VKASISRLRRVSSWRQVLPMLMLVAFALQSYVTQTHIHFAGHVVTGGFTFPGEDSKTVKALGTAQDQDDHDKYPPGDDPANCPICQEILYAGHYVARLRCRFSFRLSRFPRSKSSRPFCRARLRLPTIGKAGVRLASDFRTLSD